MEKLNNYLQQLLNTCGYELHLEPNKNPYIMTASGQVEASTNPLPGAQINSMIFSLIPNNVKQQLPNQPEVQFVHPHTLGAFSFSVKKSPSGFNVIICPAPESAITADQESSPEADAAPALTPMPTEETPSEEGDHSLSPSLDDNVADGASEKPVAEHENVESTEEYSPYAKGRYDEPGDESDPSIDFGEEADLDTAHNFEPDEFPGSQDSYQTTYESPAVEIEVEGESADLELEHSGIAEEVVHADEFQIESQPALEEPAVSASQPVEYAEPEPSAAPLKAEVEKPIEVSGSEVAEKPEQKYPVETVTTQETPAVNDSFVNQTAQAVESPSTKPKTEKQAQMDSLFVKMAEIGASDLHLSVSMPPLVRNDGKMKELEPGAVALDAESIKSLLTSIMPEKNQREFEEKNDTDFAYEIPGLARFRVNVFRDRKGMGGVFRIIPADIMTAEDLNLSKAIMKLCQLSKGLVVVTGPTGSGKSTTLCAMVDWINKNREEHIITIEDPIEFTHENKKCLVNQREVNNHTKSFKNALRAALREDPDIVLVGEMRDLETVSIAIETAETGHLVFGTLHTTTAASTVDRIIDQFPADRQQQIRVMLSESLKGVIAQTLVPKVGGGRIAALETLVVTPAIANLIREGKTFQIQSQMQTGKNLGMVLLNDSLMELVEKGLVEPKDAYIKAVDKDNFESLLKRNGKSV